LPQTQRMAGRTKLSRAEMAVRVLALISAALALMCAGLAWAWKTQRDESECWRVAAQYQIQLADCRG